MTSIVNTHIQVHLHISMHTHIHVHEMLREDGSVNMHAYIIRWLGWMALIINTHMHGCWPGNG